MTTTLAPDTTSIDAFAAKAARDAEHAFRVLRTTGTLASNGTIFFAERIPGIDRYLLLVDPGSWAHDQHVAAVHVQFDDHDLDGQRNKRAAEFGFGAIFAARPDVTTIVHVHSVYLGAWSQTHRPFPLHYVPAQRWTLARELPSYIDRTQPHGEFIIERLQEEPSLPAILEANGGATVWGTRGLLATAEYIQILEEGAKLQTLAAAIGGSQPYGPGVLQQQWKMSGLAAEARARGLLA